VTCFIDQVKTYSVYVREVTMVPMVPMVLLGGSGIEVHRSALYFTQYNLGEASLLVP
jgi:hypothetical protein